MFVIVAYDVLQKRVGKVMRICRKYLVHIQKSVFEGQLTEVKLKRLKLELGAVINTEEDAICIYRMESLQFLKMMLVEARARQEYYSAFNEILKQSDFLFTKRSQRPPQDELNAMISFGNTLLYNVVYQSIFKSSLDIRIGIIHAANHRYFSLNLDFADVWKPIIVDRVIFSLVNCLQIKSKEHFERKNDGVYLNKDGKRLFLEAFEKKLQDKLVVNGKKSTYRRLIENDVFGYQRYIMTRESYKPFKYY